MQLDWLADSPASYVSRLGRVPYDFGEFISVPMSAAETAELDQVVAKIAALHSKRFLTAEIPDGLQVITPAVAQSFAGLLARYNWRGGNLGAFRAGDERVVVHLGSAADRVCGRVQAGRLLYPPAGAGVGDGVVA